MNLLAFRPSHVAIAKEDNIDNGEEEQQLVFAATEQEQQDDEYIFSYRIFWAISKFVLLLLSLLSQRNSPIII
jgi:hypothetical protein